MFSVREKRMISEAVQQILRSTRHPELPDDEIRFQLVVRGKEQWSWADIRNNGAVPEPGVNPHNEAQDQNQFIEHISYKNGFPFPEVDVVVQTHGQKEKGNE